MTTPVSLAPTFGVGWQAFTSGGLPLNAGLLNTYIAGGTTPQATYTTSAGSVANANPIVLGADGRPPAEIWLLQNGAYRFDLTDAIGNLIASYDNITGIGSNEIINVLSYPGADVGAQLQNAINAAPAGAVIDGRMVTGTVAAAATVTISKPVKILWGDSRLVCAGCPGVTIPIGGAGTEIEGMGQLSQWATSATSNCDVLYLNATQYITIHGMNFTATGASTDTATPTDGIYVFQSSNVDIFENYFSLTNIGVRILDNAIAGTNPRNCRVHHNYFLSAYGPNNGGYGVLHVRGLENQIDHNIFSPGPFQRHAIYVSAGSRRVTVDHNTVTGSTLAGINVNSGTGGGDAITDLILDGNLITGNGGTTAFGYNIGITGGISNSQITNNIGKAASSHAFLVQAASGTVFPSSLIIDNNQFSGAYSEGMSLNDLTTSIISSNRCGGNALDGTSQAEIDVAKLLVAATNNEFRDNRADSGMLFGVRLDAKSGLNRVSGTVGTTTQQRVLDNGDGSNGINYIHENLDGIQVNAAATGAIAIDAGAGSLVQWTLTGNVTITTTTYSPLKGQPLEFIFTQDAGAGRTVGWPGNFKTAWVDTGNTANKVSSIKFIFDGTNFQQVGAQMLYH
jgi:hypothetical protein